MVQRPSGNQSMQHANIVPSSLVKSSWVLGKIYPIIPGRLSFTAHHDDDHTNEQISRNIHMFYFSSDFHEHYEPYCADFGPVNLSVVYRFCELMNERMNDLRLKNRHLVYYSDENPLVQTNVAMLLASYVMLCQGWKAEQAVEPFAKIEPNPFKPFRDATYLPPDFPVTLLDCLHGLQKAQRLGWFEYDTFDVEDYEYWDHPLNGDLHSIMPCCEEGAKFVAFKGPSATRERIAPGIFTFTAKEYVEVFKDKGVSCVVRLNEPESYDRKEFISNGIKHVDLYFDDCTVPAADIVERFLDLCDEEPGAIAVHCKAGLGRTGTLIAVWMMKNHGFTANEAIAWLRIVRPGSVIGPQQAYLQALQHAAFVGNRVPLTNSLPNEQDAAASLALAEQVATAMQLRAFNRSVPTVGGGGAPTVGGGVPAVGLGGYADGEHADRVQPEAVQESCAAQARESSVSVSGCDSSVCDYDSSTED